MRGPCRRTARAYAPAGCNIKVPAAWRPRSTWGRGGCITIMLFLMYKCPS
jgi:hypothetical protein